MRSLQNVGPDFHTWVSNLKSLIDVNKYICVTCPVHNRALCVYVVRAAQVNEVDFFGKCIKFRLKFKIFLFLDKIYYYYKYRFPLQCMESVQ